MAILGTLNSVDKARFSVNNLGTAQNWTLEIEIIPVSITQTISNISGVARITSKTTNNIDGISRVN